jgi:hypothetical protein
MKSRCILFKKLGAITLFICFTMFCWSSYAGEWSPLGATFPFQYTVAQTNIVSSNTIQMVFGTANGIIEYYNPNQAKWINIPGPSAEGGNAVTALHCTWDNTDSGGNNNLPNILAGYSDGSIYQFLPNSSGAGSWSKIANTPSSDGQVIQIGSPRLC